MTRTKTAARERRARVEPTELEIDAARRFVERSGKNLRFAQGLGWLRYTGTHWTPDEREHARELVKGFVDELRVEAAELNDQRLWPLCTSLGRSRGISSLLDSARSDERVRVVVDDFDAHPHLLAVRNGVVDLRDGTLRPHDASLLLTRRAPAAYVAGAQHESLDRLLAHLMPDAGARAYLQRAVGYSLTSSASEDVIFLIVGPPRCGKSTLLRALVEALGEHVASASMRTFCVAKGISGGGARPDLFRLLGRRLVAASEIHPGLEFDSGLLKSIAGGERLTVRALYQDEIEVRTTWTLWLVANDGDLPRMRSEDDALWERVRRIPVGATLAADDRDRGLRDSFADPAARSAVLSWAVEGAIACHRAGLGAPPVEVRNATAELRSTMDTVAPFIDVALRFDAHDTTAKRVVREAYEAWADASGERPASAKRLAAALRATAERSGAPLAETTMRDAARKVVPAWRGLRHATDVERATEEPSGRGVETCRTDPTETSSTHPINGVSGSRALHTSTSLPTHAADNGDAWEEGRE